MDRGLGGARHLPLRPQRRPARRLLDRHAAADGVGLAAHRPRVLYTHTDTIARFQRMRGKRVFYPMGFDDNGLRLSARADVLWRPLRPSLPMSPTSSRRDAAKDPIACHARTSSSSASLDRGGREGVRDPLARLGLSSTGGSPTPPSASGPGGRPAELLDLLAAGHVYQREAPTLWDVDFRTAVSQAELEDREQPGAYHRIAFDRVDGTVPSRSRRRAECWRLRGPRRPPDDAATSRCSAATSSPALRRARPGRAHELADPRRVGHRHDLHIRRHDRRHLVA